MHTPLLTTTKSKGLPWHAVEKAIFKEMKWLKETLLENPHQNKDVCYDCIYRRLAILIISGKIKARDIKSTISLWGGNVSKSILEKPHGKEWHVKMMNLLSNYFQSLNYDVAIEPNLNMGRADLGIYKQGQPSLFVEIGTVSLRKLLFNLESMEDSTFLLVLDKNHAVEFSIIKAGYKSQTI